MTPPEPPTDEILPEEREIILALLPDILARLRETSHGAPLSLTISQIAEATGFSPATIERAQHTALAKLRTEAARRDLF